MLDVLSVDVQGQVIRIDDGLDKVKVFGEKVFELIINKDSSDKKFNFVIFLIEFFELVVWSSFRNVH